MKMSTVKLQGTGLEDVGVPGQSYLRDALTSCTDPLKAIEEFQLENGILLPSLRPMLPLLDLHGVRRLEFHTSVLEELRDRLVQHINEIGQKEGKERDRKFKELLAKSFSVVRVKALRPVVMCILRNTPHIDEKYLKVLVRDRELYCDTDTEVKRQIWKDNQSLFGDEVSPLLGDYIKEKENILFDHLNLTNLFFSPSPKDIISVDPCHKFTWCLDACIREKNVDIKRSRELQGFLDSIKRGQEQVLGDLSMTLCDPYAINFLATSATKILQHLINNEGLPRDNTVLILLLRMLALGLSPPPDACQAYVQESSVASILAMYYTLHTARQKDRVGLMRVLGTLANCKNDRAFEDPFLHSLVSLLIHMSEEFTAEDFCTVIFDEFFFAGLARDNVPKHLLKLLWYIYPKLPAMRLQTLVKVLQPTSQHNEAVHRLYDSLQERIGSQQGPPPVPVNLDHLDSPLMSVPTPAPL
ncbi:hypothetical protein C0J52_08709 [Blattella germanica]|nr:hypothetical protein C0J52_08709 [Blattella germanica]